MRLSSNATLLLKVFLPTFWVTVFGLFALVILFAEEDKLGVFAFDPYKYGYFVFFGVFLVFMYFTLMCLQRVECDREHLYVTNYFKTYKYPVHIIESLLSIDFLLFKLITVKCRETTYFGRKIYFIAKKSNYDIFLEEHRDYLASL